MESRLYIVVLLGYWSCALQGYLLVLIRACVPLRLSLSLGLPRLPFYTLSVQNGCIYDWGCFEPNPEMETTIAALSAGPVGPSDMIGRLNKSTHPSFSIKLLQERLNVLQYHIARIMQTCREDGLLLKPDRPATPLDAVFSSQVSR